MSNENSTLFLSDKTYKVLKHLTQIVLPALGALYFGLSEIWGFPHGEQVIGTIAVITTFFGIVLQISSMQYNGSNLKYDGRMLIGQNASGKKMFTLELDSDPEDLEQMNEVSFRVENELVNGAIFTEDPLFDQDVDETPSV